MQRCFGELLVQVLQQRSECLLLLRCSGVLGCASVFGAPTDVADAYGMGIVSLAVRSALRERSADVERTIAINHEVIADVAEAALQVPLAYLLHGEVLALRGGRAMNDDF